MALLLAVSGCSHDFDSLYEGSGDEGTDGRAGSGTSQPAELPWLPALPDHDYRADCERCAQSKCVAQHAECLKDDDCIDELKCKGLECDDPACLQTCNAEHGWSPWYADYWNCVFGTECGSECNAGNNLECVHDYQWPNAAADKTTFEVVFVFENSPTFYLGDTFAVAPVGATIRACLDDPTCSELDSAPLGARNSVELELTADALTPRDFRGYLEVDHGGDSVDRWLHYPPPLSRAQKHFVGPGGAGTFGPPDFDPTRARVRAIVSDCLGAPVAQARVTLPDMPEISAFAITNRTLYEKGLTTPTGVAELVDLPDSAADDKVLVRAERASTGDLIAERKVWLRPGFLTRLWLGPASLSD